MDLETAEPASTRRSLISAAGRAGLVGAAAGIVASSRAAATSERLSDADRVTLESMTQLELSARDLYREAAAKLEGDDAELASVAAANHSAYAQAIAGLTGSSANQRDDDTFDSLRSAFNSTDPQEFARAARDLENTAVASHTGLLGQYDGLVAIDLTVSILAVEARHATVFTSMAGFAGNLDEMFGSA